MEKKSDFDNIISKCDILSRYSLVDVGISYPSLLNYVSQSGSFLKQVDLPLDIITTFRFR